MMAVEIASAINTALFHQQAPAYIRIMSARRNAKGEITAITYQNSTGENPLQYRAIIITAGRTVDKGVVEVEENESWEQVKIQAVPLVRYIGTGMEGLQCMQHKFDSENEGIKILSQVRWLAIPGSSGRGGRTERLPHHWLSWL
jgi:hypothetical protein